MNKSCIRETGSTDDLNYTHQKQTSIYLSATKKELSKSIEVSLFARKRKAILDKNIQESGITVDLQSNLRPPKKSLELKKNNKFKRNNHSIVLKPKNLIFSRLNSLEAEPLEKKLIIQRTKSSKRSIHLRRILSYGPSVKGDKQNKASLKVSGDNYNQSKLQKIGTENIFLLAWPKNKNILSLNESFKGQNQMKQKSKVKRFDVPIFREESIKEFLPTNPKKSRQ